MTARTFRAADAFFVLLLATAAWIAIPGLIPGHAPELLRPALTSVGLLAAVAVGVRMRDCRLAPLMAPGAFTASVALWTLLGTAGLSLVLMSLSEPLLDLFRRMGADYQPELEGLKTWIESIPTPAAWLILVALVPVAEEAVFRGAVLKGFRASWGVAPALLLSSLLFGAIHLMPPRIVVTFALGLWFGALALRSGGGAAPVVAHALNNALVLFFMARGVERIPVDAAAAGAFAFLTASWRLFGTETRTMQGSGPSAPS